MVEATVRPAKRTIAIDAVVRTTLSSYLKSMDTRLSANLTKKV